MNDLDLKWFREFALSPSSEASWTVALTGKLPVLLQGPTGSGKSRLAARIHALSPRAKGPWVTINVASLSEGVFESELFGHERGAFTGAQSRRRGRIEQAQGGTLFLDEIGELSLRQQSRLLELLQTREFYPVGSDRKQLLDAQIIVATHRDLTREVAEGRFREDLLHRLRVVSLELQPLHALSEHWGEVIHQCLGEVCAELGKSVRALSAEVASLLETYHWPGNWRELRHALEYAVLSSRGGTIQWQDLPQWIVRAANPAAEALSSSPPPPELSLGMLTLPCDINYNRALTQFERRFLERALRKFRGRVNETARRTGMSKNTLIRRMRRHSLRSPRPRIRANHGKNVEV